MTRSMARVKSPLPSASKRILSPTSCALPHASITQASLTAIQAMVSTPLAFNSSDCVTKPGRCTREHPGVNAPGTAKSTTLPLPSTSPVRTESGAPSGPIVLSSMSGILSPTERTTFPPAVNVGRILEDLRCTLRLGVAHRGLLQFVRRRIGAVKEMQDLRYAILEAPSVLGLFPHGVERLPAALLDAGLAEALRARRAGCVTPPPYDA